MYSKNINVHKLDFSRILMDGKQRSPDSFRGSLDIYVSGLLTLDWAKNGAFGQKIEALDEKASDTEEQVIRDVTVAILSVHEDDDALNAVNVSVVLVKVIIL
ncbi:uncharacterized protein V6R79_023396 [Siganus canaliculatus]